MFDQTYAQIDCQNCHFQYLEGTAHNCLTNITYEILSLKKEIKELRQSQVRNPNIVQPQNPLAIHPLVMENKYRIDELQKFLNLQENDYRSLIEGLKMQHNEQQLELNGKIKEINEGILKKTNNLLREVHDEMARINDILKMIDFEKVKLYDQQQLQRERALEHQKRVQQIFRQEQESDNSRSVVSVPPPLKQQNFPSLDKGLDQLDAKKNGKKKIQMPQSDSKCNRISYNEESKREQSLIHDQTLNFDDEKHEFENPRGSINFEQQLKNDDTSCLVELNQVINANREIYLAKEYKEYEEEKKEYDINDKTIYSMEYNEKIQEEFELQNDHDLNQDAFNDADEEADIIDLIKNDQTTHPQIIAEQGVPRFKTYLNYQGLKFSGRLENDEKQTIFDMAIQYLKHHQSTFQTQSNLRYQFVQLDSESKFEKQASDEFKAWLRDIFMKKEAIGSYRYMDKQSKISGCFFIKHDDLMLLNQDLLYARDNYVSNQKGGGKKKSKGASFGLKKEDFNKIGMKHIDIYKDLKENEEGDIDKSFMASRIILSEWLASDSEFIF